MFSGDRNLSVLSRQGQEAPTSQAGDVPRPPSRWRSRVLLPGLLLAGFVSLAVYAGRDVLWRGIDVQVVPAIAKSTTDTGGGTLFQAPGWVEADPYSTYVSALTDGVVKEVLVLEGDTIQAGQPVATLVAEDAQLAVRRLTAEMAQREAGIQSAAANLAAAQRDWDFPIERDRMVAVAQALLDGTKAERKQLEADVRMQAVNLAVAKEQLRREADVSVEALPEFQRVRSALEVQAETAKLESVEARIPVLEARIQELEAELKASQEQLCLRIRETKELEEAKAVKAAADAALAETAARLAEANLRLQRMTIHAGVDGIVMARLISPGDKLMLAGDSRHSAQVVQLYDPTRLQVRVDVPLADAAKIGVGLRAQVVVGVLPERSFEGEITRIVHEADIQKNTLQVKVAIRSPALELKPEMLARVTFLAPAQKDGEKQVQHVFVPRRVVIGTGADTHVWVVTAGDRRVERRKVELGADTRGSWVQVVGGLTVGDRIVANPPAGLSDGAKINVVGEDRTEE